jgi:hypothetical protein
MFPVRYELGLYIPEDGILHRHRCENHTVWIYVHINIMRDSKSCTVSERYFYEDGKY